MLAFGFLFCGVISLMHVRGQLPGNGYHYQPQGRPRNGPGNVYNLSNPDVPSNWQDLMMAGNGVHDIRDFIRLLKTPDGRQVTQDDIFSDYQSEDGRLVVTGGGLMAVPDDCSPRNVSVRLPLDYSDNQLAYYPECTKVQRCGGCSPTQFLSCEPLYKEKLVLKVLRARYLSRGSYNMQWEGFTSVEVERHLSCQAVCTLRQSDCGPRKRFMPFQCKCQCERFTRCSGGQRWDDDSCSCRCRQERACCDENDDERTCVSFFDRNNCRCALKQSIGAAVNATQEEIEAWLANRANQETTTSVPVILPTTTDAITACRRRRRFQRCPRNFTLALNRSGRCVCQLSGFRRPRYRG